MTWDSVPWFVGGGAHHSPEVARLLAFAATGGAEGIITPGDLKVVPLAVAGASIRVLAGAALILNKAAGGAQQTYVGRNPSEDVKGIAATGSGSGRSDLVVAQIKDPFMPGEPWADPADVTKGPYIFTEIIPNVAPGTTKVPSGVSGIPLARIDIPANTATITADHIKDLRKLALPRSWNEYDIQATVQAESLVVAQQSWTNFPTNSLPVEIPSWATDASVSISLPTVLVDAPSDMETRVQLGGLLGVGNLFDYNGSNGTPVGFAEKVPHATFAEFDVRGYQGTTQTLRLNARRIWPQNTGTIYLDPRLQVIFDVRFYERAV